MKLVFIVYDLVRPPVKALDNDFRIVIRTVYQIASSLCGHLY